MATTQHNPGTSRNFFSKKRLRYFVLGIAAAILLIGGYFAVTLLIYPTVLAQQAIRFLPDAAIPQQGQKVLVFAPHPDDETIGVGGYIAQAIQQGADVRIVLVTDGNKHHNESIRYAEFKKATGILGVPESNLVFLNYPDGTLRSQNQTALYQSFKEQIDAYNPDIVIYPYIHDFHPDHAVTGKIVNNVLAGTNNTIIAFQYLVHYEFYYPHPKNLDVSAYLLPPARLVRFGNNWQKVMLPDPIEKLKEQAVYSYSSQLNDPLLKNLLLSNIRQNELLLAR